MTKTTTIDEPLDICIPLNILAIYVDSEYIQAMKDYEEGVNKYGENYGQKPEAPKKEYVKKHINTSAYRIDSWNAMWDKESDCEIISAQWTHLAGGFVDNINVKMKAWQWIKALEYFNTRVIEMDFDEQDTMYTYNGTGDIIKHE